LCYFEGAVQVWKWLKENSFNVTPLYFGKLSYVDSNLALQLNPSFVPLLPSFYILNPHKYAEEVQRIGEWNGFDQFKL
jgi:hypothetical protein